MNLKNQAEYDQAVLALKTLGFTPASIWIHAMACDIIEAIEDPEQFEPGATVTDIIDNWTDFLYEDKVTDIEEAWSLIEGH